MNAPARKEWFYRYSPRNGGDLAGQRVRDQVLDMWAAGKSKNEIAQALGIHVNTVKMATARARKDGDVRAFKNTKPLVTSQMEVVSVLDLYQEQWVVRGLAKHLDMHFTKIEQALRKVVKELEERK